MDTEAHFRSSPMQRPTFSNWDSAPLWYFRAAEGRAIILGASILRNPSLIPAIQVSEVLALPLGGSCSPGLRGKQ